MTRPLLFLLRAVLVALFTGTLFVQTVMAAVVFMSAAGGPAEAVRVPVVAVIVLGGLCVEAVLVSVWRLATLAHRGAVFSARSFRWVDVIVGAGAAASVLLLSLAAALAPQPDAVAAPGVVLLLGIAALVPLGVALVVLVMRVLLAQAIAREEEARRLRAELEDVI
ncbi:DUF2975 domain-containing protein [Demequina pelophila]|uniref:DUF2975 domain-containing protein n=1 Tax=Demequina pelophila TaxID=1638984 RepID=UPI0007812D98|nr:DUF2975 domain-containing protein [Demequina pelophila]